MDFRLGDRFDFDAAAAFTARLVEEIDDVPLPEGTLLNVNVPAGEIEGVEVVAARQAHLPRPALARRRGVRPQAVPHLRRRARARRRGRHRPRRDRGGRIAVTPLHFDLTDRPGIETLQAYDLARLLAPAAREVE